MKKPFQPLWILLAVLGLVILPGRVCGNERLAAFREAFEKRLNGELDAHGEKARTLRMGYLEALKKLQAELARAGKLKEATQVLTEIEAVEDGAEAQALPKDADYRLKRIRKKWDEGLKDIIRERKKNTATTAKLYLKALDEEKRKLTVANKIKEALAFEEEAKRVVELPEVKAAMPATVDDPPDVEGDPGELPAFLVGKVYTYEREDGRPRKIAFVEKGAAIFLDDKKRKFKWRLSPAGGSRIIFLEDPKWSSPISLKFSEDGITYTGSVVSSGSARSGTYLEPYDKK